MSTVAPADGPDTPTGKDAPQTPDPEILAPETPARETPAPQTPALETVEIPGRALARPRVSAAGAVIGLLLGLLGFALVVQLHGNTADEQLRSARPEDLVRILADLDARSDRLRQEIRDLEESRRQLQSGAQGQEAALAGARRRADELGILAGTIAARGPGLTIIITQGGQPVGAAQLLDAVEELRGAGAEAMQIRDTRGAAVRVVASTYLVDAGDNVLVDDVLLAASFTIEVIGEPQTMQTALNIPGGVVDSIRQHGGTVTVRESDAIDVSTLHHGDGLKFARPVS